jgi:DcmR-like sensory protein/histidine kinase-like protein
LQPDAFAEVIGGLVGRSLTRRSLSARRPLRVYGEVVALLWDEGDIEAAAELEQLWNRLCDREAFNLLCTYPTPREPEQLQALREVCRSHSSVAPLITASDAPVGLDIAAEFDPDLEAPRRVRALLRSALSELPVNQDLIECGTLAASELAANAVLHARTPFRLLVQARESSLWIAVEDRSPLRDRREVLGRTPHGLALIAAFALRWGVTPYNNGKVVWAELPLDGLATPAGHTQA